MPEVEFYRTVADHCPVEEFLDGLPAKQAQKVAWVLRLIEDLESVPSQYLKKLVGAKEIWEVRAHQGGEAFRLMGFFAGARLLVLTSGFSKKTQRVPRREIQLAEERRRDYLKRRSSHE